MFGIGIGRNLISWLFSLTLLGALWITALAGLSSPETATNGLTELGANVLNPYLVNYSLGLSPQGYTALQQAAVAHPDQALALPGLKARVLGSEIIHHDYAAGVRVVYRHVAETYYAGGPSAVFEIPPQLKQIIATYAVFTAPQQQQQQIQQQLGVPQLPHLPQLPTFLQPFFTYIGLSPDTLTAQGHSRYVSLEVYWWGATLVLGALVVLLGARGRRLTTVSQAVMSGSLPMVALFGVVWVLALVVFTQQFQPYRGALNFLSGVFLPVYGTALVVGIVLRVIPAALRMVQGQGSAALASPRPSAGMLPMGGYPQQSQNVPPMGGYPPYQREAVPQPYQPYQREAAPQAYPPYQQGGAPQAYPQQPAPEPPADPNAPTTPIRWDEQGGAGNTQWRR